MSPIALLRMAHFGFLHAGKFTVDQEPFNPAWHLCVQDVTPHFNTPEELHYISIHLKVSKTDPFGWGGWCDYWLLLASNFVGLVQLRISYNHIVPTMLLPVAPFFQLSGQLLMKNIVVGHIKGLRTTLGLNPSFYSRHPMHIEGATTAAVASLKDWEIKSMGCWKSSTYQTYIRETRDMKINCAKKMASAPASIHLQLQLTISSHGQLVPKSVLPEPSCLLLINML